jgi:cell division septation protein DedD
MRYLGRQLLVASAAMTVMAGAAYADVQAGINAWQSGNFEGALKEWRPLADKGDADAQFNLGQAYKLGRGVRADLKIAQSWYEKAAQQGHGQAQANLGLILFQNGERERAMPWIRRAADAGDPRAQYVLGTSMFNGDFIPKDWPRAYALMQRAAAQGLPHAATNLQQMDKYIPLAQRQAGLKLAAAMEKNAAQIASARPSRAPQAPGKVGQAFVPPSNPALQSTIEAPAPARSSQAKPAAAKPAPAKSAPAPVRVAAAQGGGWKVQLGAFGTAANAQRQWTALKGKVGALGSLQPHYASAGAVTRLQAGPLASRAAADRVCAAAKAAGSACFPVAP